MQSTRTHISPIMAGKSSGKVSILAFAAKLFALHTQRKRLKKLDNDALADIGISRNEADREAVRPLWDVPSHWRK